MQRRTGGRGGATWGRCLLGAGALMGLCFAFCEPAFETNDDNGIIAIASGAFTGSPYGANGYTTYLYGALLRTLYSLWAGAPWHTLAMLGAVLVSLAAMLRSIAVVSRRHDIPLGFGFSAFLALVFGVFARYITTLQYTATAAFAGAAGVCLLVALPGAESRREKMGLLLPAAGLLLFSFCLRTDSFWVCIPLLAGYCAMEALERRSLGSLLPCVVVAGAGALLGLADQALYRAYEPSWDAFRVFYDLRCQLLDYYNTDFMERAATQVLGWPEATVRMIRNWYLLDARITAQGLGVLVEAAKEAGPPPTVGSVVKATASVLRRYSMFGLNFAAFGLWGIGAGARLGKAKGWAGLARILGTAVYGAVFIAYFYGVLGRLPERAAFTVACPAYGLLILACLPAWGNQREEPRAAPAAPKRGLAVCMALLLLAGAATLGLEGGRQLPLRWKPSAQAGREALSINLRDYAKEDPSMVYVTDIPQRYGPFYTGATAAVNLVEWGHAMQGSDMYRAKLKANGLEALTTDTLFAPNVRVIVTHSNLDMLQNYLRVLYPDTQWEMITTSPGYGVYRLMRGV